VPLLETVDGLMLWVINYYSKAELQIQTSHKDCVNLVYKITCTKHVILKDLNLIKFQDLTVNNVNLLQHPKIARELIYCSELFTE
jgi:hypothetical protein